MLSPSSVAPLALIGVVATRHHNQQWTFTGHPPPNWLPTNAWLATPDSDQPDSLVTEGLLRPACAAVSTWKLGEAGGGQGGHPGRRRRPLWRYWTPPINHEVHRILSSSVFTRLSCTMRCFHLWYISIQGQTLRVLGASALRVLY